MDYEALYSSGTDDDLPPSYHNRTSKRGRGGEKGRPAVDLAPQSRLSSTMEAQIHSLEQEAYASVLRAFQAQSDAISWEKEGLMAELRKELRVSDGEHRELLLKVKADDTIHKIREWRQTGRNQVMLHSPQHLHDTAFKKRRTSESVQHLSNLASVKPMPYPFSDSRIYNNNNPPTAVRTNGSTEADPHIGERVWMRLPEDNRIYEAVISDYNLLEMPCEDIRWGEDPSSISSERIRGAVDPKKGCNGPTKNHPRKETFSGPPIGVVNQLPDDIELFNTNSLVKEVSRVFCSSNPDPAEIFKAKRMLKEHELALVEAIARLGDASDGERDGEQAFAEGQIMEY